MAWCPSLPVACCVMKEGCDFKRVASYFLPICNACSEDSWPSKSTCVLLTVRTLSSCRNIKYNLKLFYLKSDRSKNLLQDRFGAVTSEHLEKLVEIYNTVVTIRTKSFNIHKFYFCPHSVFLCFVWISEQTAIISPRSINWLVCITETVCLLRGTDWVVVYNSVYVFCVVLRTNNDYFPIQH